MIRSAIPQDAEPIASIYNHYVRKTVITFEEEPVSPEVMLDRMVSVQRAGLPWLVAVENKHIVGYAYAGPWHARSAYRYTVECTVYLAAEHQSRGWGTRMYEALFAVLREQDVHVVIGGITLPNPASVALHEKFGMEQAAHYKEVGYKFNTWLDVGYWQVRLDAESGT